MKSDDIDMRAAIGLFTKLDARVEIATGSVTKSPKNPLFEQTEPWESTNGGSINVRLQLSRNKQFIFTLVLTEAYVLPCLVPTHHTGLAQHVQVGPAV